MAQKGSIHPYLNLEFSKFFEFQIINLHISRLSPFYTWTCYLTKIDYFHKCHPWATCVSLTSPQLHYIYPAFFFSLQTIIFGIGYIGG